MELPTVNVVSRWSTSWMKGGIRSAVAASSHKKVLEANSQLGIWRRCSLNGHEFRCCHMKFSFRAGSPGQRCDAGSALWCSGLNRDGPRHLEDAAVVGKVKERFPSSEQGHCKHVKRKSVMPSLEDGVFTLMRRLGPLGAGVLVQIRTRNCVTDQKFVAGAEIQSRESNRCSYLFSTLRIAQLWCSKSLGFRFSWLGGFQALALTLALLFLEAGATVPPCYGEIMLEPTVFAERKILPPLPSEFPDLRDITPVSYEQLTLGNGLRVFLLEDHELGLVGGELLVRGGSKLDPSDKVGLAAMTSIVQRSGGSKTHPAEELDSKLEVMAARIESSSSVSEMSVGFRCLTEDLEEVFSLFTEVVQEPLMPEDKLELIRFQFVGSIARRPDDAAGIAGREFSKILYGDDSVYARVPETSTISAVSGSDLRRFHQQTFRPEKGVLGIWGDFDSKNVKKIVEDKFTRWRVRPDAQVAVVEVSSLPLEQGYSAGSPSVYLIDRPGLTQGYVRMGELGTTLADPDVFSLDVLNGILNGYGGLLFDEVRSREGLAYSVSGGWSPAVEHRGAFVAGGETRVQAIPQFVQAVKRVLNKVCTEPADPDTLAKAKEAALNSFVFNFTDSGAQLARVMSYELFNIDQDFLFRYKSGVEGTSALDVLDAAQRHLHVNEQPVLIVTDAREVAPLLSVLDLPIINLKPSYLS